MVSAIQCFAWRVQARVLCSVTPPSQNQEEERIQHPEAAERVLVAGRIDRRVMRSMREMRKERGKRCPARRCDAENLPRRYVAGRCKRGVREKRQRESVSYYRCRSSAVAARALTRQAERNDENQRSNRCCNVRFIGEVQGGSSAACVEAKCRVCVGRCGEG